jgi:hypothetical protein
MEEKQLHLSAFYHLRDHPRSMSALLDSANLDLASTPGLPPVAPVAPAPSHAPPPPAAIPTAQQARVLDGVHTEVFVQIYADRILVIVTQLGRIGCLVSAGVGLLVPHPPPPGLTDSLLRRSKYRLRRRPYPPLPPLRQLYLPAPLRALQRPSSRPCRHLIRQRSSLPCSASLRTRTSRRCTTSMRHRSAQ